jgi:hypothetical protein
VEHDDSADRIAQLEEQVAHLTRDNVRLSSELQALLNRLFRRKSEKLDPRQLSLFLEEVAAAAAAPPIEEKPNPVKKKAGHGRRPFRKDLVRITETIELAPTERRAATVAQRWSALGSKSPSEATSSLLVWW